MDADLGRGRNEPGARRLGPDAIERMVDELRREGLRVMEAEYRSAAFGSWHIVVCGKRGCLRVAFDGRDGFLSYERWKGGPEYDPSRGWEPGRWEGLEFLDPSRAAAEAWTEAAICARVRHHVGTGP